MQTTAKKILIVDDDNRNIFALSAYLRSRKFSCMAAANAREALNVLEKDPSVAVVLMDMMMPGMDGNGTIAAIRAKESERRAYVIAVTAQAMTGDRGKCLAAGADEYISKPVDKDALIQLIDQYLVN